MFAYNLAWKLADALRGLSPRWKQTPPSSSNGVEQDKVFSVLGTFDEGI